jgi:hypothetical protein
MWQAAGASIVNIPSNEVYNALQTGVIQGTDTSTGSFVSFRIYEQVKCVTAPGDNALWFMYEPVLMSKKSFGRLNKAQQAALLAAGKKSQAYFAKEAKKLDDDRSRLWRTGSRSQPDASGIRPMDESPSEAPTPNSQGSAERQKLIAKPEREIAPSAHRVSPRRAPSDLGPWIDSSALSAAVGLCGFVAALIAAGVLRSARWFSSATAQ